MSRSWLPGVLLVVLALGSAWFLNHLKRSDGEADGGQRHNPDFFMRDFSTVRMGTNGLPERELRAEHMVHYPDTDSSELARPHLVIHQPPRPPWHVGAESGWVSPDSEVVLLQGRVRIWQESRDRAGQIEIHTRDLRVLPESLYAETDRPVSIRAAGSETKSVGMRVFMQEHRIELLSQVLTYFEPRRTN